MGMGPCTILSWEWSEGSLVPRSRPAFRRLQYGESRYVQSSLEIDLIRERVIMRLRHSLPDGKLQKEERPLCFTAGLL